MMAKVIDFYDSVGTVWNIILTDIVGNYVKYINCNSLRS